MALQFWKKSYSGLPENISTLYKIYRYDRIPLTKVHGIDNGALKIRALG